MSFIWGRVVIFQWFYSLSVFLAQSQFYRSFCHFALRVVCTRKAFICLSLSIATLVPTLSASDSFLKYFFFFAQLQPFEWTKYEFVCVFVWICTKSVVWIRVSLWYQHWIKAFYHLSRILSHSKEFSALYQIDTEIYI